MRANKEIIYTIYLNEDEFELFYNITKSIDYGYVFIDNEFKIIMTEDMLSDIEDKLDAELYNQKYEECNTAVANRIIDLLDEIYEIRTY